MFNQDFKEFIESLNANQVRYLMVDGYASESKKTNSVDSLQYTRFDFGRQVELINNRESGVMKTNQSCHPEPQATLALARKRQ